MKPSLRSHYFLFYAVVFLLSACTPLISIFDETSYKNAIDLKVDFHYLVEASKSSYKNHEEDIAAFRKKLDKAYEYEKGRFKNQITVEQYNVLRKADGPIDGFFDLWLAQDSTSQTFRESKIKISDQSFDEILGLEKSKRREGIRLKLTDPDSNQTK
jgi:hypothetical protein